MKTTTDIHFAANARFKSSLQASRLNQATKRAELQHYFPGLYKDSQIRTQPEVISKSFATHLNAALSHEDIQKEIQSDPQKKKLYNASLGFQSLFIERMLNSMRKNLNPQNNLLYGGFRQKVFEDMLYQEHAKALSRTGSFHLADDIYRQLRPTLLNGK